MVTAMADAFAEPMAGTCRHCKLPISRTALGWQDEMGHLACALPKPKRGGYLLHEPEENPVPELGKIAYEAYCQAVGWVSVKGDLLPQWAEQDARIALAWDAAAQAVARAVHDAGD
jgi:hypothetical protein